MLFTGNTKIENKFPKGQSMWHEINNGVYVADQTQFPVKQ